MKFLLTILIISLISTICYCQDSVTAKVKRVSGNTIQYEINKMKFVSFDCKCSLKRGDTFKITKERFDSLLLEAKPIRKKQIEL